MSKKISLQRSSGADARKWRRTLAASANRSNDSIRSLKFPLSVDASADWDAVRRLHHITASDASGSLIGLLFALHLNGFRVFGKTSTTEAFRNSAVLDDHSWSDSVLSTSALTVARDTFVPSRIYQRLQFAPRATNGKDSGFTASVIAIEYAKYFCAGKHGENLPEVERKLFDALGQSLSAAFADWKTLTDHVTDAAGIIDQTLATLGYAVPSVSLQRRIASVKPVEPVGTVAFDPDAPCFTETTGVALNLIVSRALAVARQHGITEKNGLTRFAQEYVTGDANHGGLAWIFGKGLTAYFSQVDAPQAMLDFNIPEHNAAAVGAVLAFAKGIPAASTTFLGGKSYADHRSGIGGTLCSWIANYLSRLVDLQASLSAAAEPIVFPPALLSDEKLFAEIGVTPDEIAALADRAITNRDPARVSLERLAGIGDVAGLNDVVVVEDYNSQVATLSGILAMVREKISKSIAIAKAERDKTALKVLENDYKFSIPDWIKPLERINRLNLTPVDPKAELVAASRRFGMLHDAMHKHYALIREWADRSGETLDPIARIAAHEKTLLQKKQGNHERAAREQAVRSCLDTIGRAARRCSDATVRVVVRFFEQQDIFVDQADLNRYFFNRQGMLYKSAFNKNPRQPFAIQRSVLERIDDILVSYGNLLAGLRDGVMSREQIMLSEVIDLYHLERGHFAMRLKGFPAQIPVEFAIVEEARESFNLPDPLRWRLMGDAVSSHIMRQIFNHYYVQLADLAAILLRDGFYLRAKFQRAGDNALRYVPANQMWNAPERLYETAAPIGQVMRRLRDAGQGLTGVDPVLAVNHLVDTRADMGDRAVRAFLRQSPHDWYFSWPTGESVAGLSVSKVGIGARMQKDTACRLIGAPAYKGVLDKMLADPDAVSIGDAAIIVDQRFTQCAKWKDGAMHVDVASSDATVALSLPVTEARAEKQDMAFDRYVAIDLGERGIGYAVFNVSDHSLVARGRVRVSSMHRLVKDDHIGKRRKSEVNKFHAAFDPAEVRRRENVVGDFCNAINRLMRYYRAFPVLEYAAGGASAAVDKVYKAVTDHYLFSSTPTVDSARQAYWMGAWGWKHPTLKQFAFDRAEQKKSNKLMELSLFPGVGVNAYGTSEECSCCHRNPMDMVRVMRGDQKEIEFTVTEGGRVQLDNGVVTLNISAPEPDRIKHRQRNERVPLTTPLGTMTISGDDLLRQLRRNLRQAPVSRQVKDTSVSVYQCVYEDCAQKQHADENAAVNIGGRFKKRIEETLDMSGSSDGK